MYDLFARGAIRCLVAAVLLISAALLSSTSQAADLTAYKLGVGDKVRVTVFGEKDLSGDFDVNDQGEVTLPLIGSVRIAGKTVGDAESFITNAYGKDYLVNPHVNLQVMNYRPFFILGEVK
ncbi:MAG TPA: polysaccharide biosynthesis/export family protein, partial [Stellaceae bacterium]